jgi:hypothetical protein
MRKITLKGSIHIKAYCDCDVPACAVLLREKVYLTDETIRVERDRTCPSCGTDRFTWGGPGKGRAFTLPPDTEGLPEVTKVIVPCHRCGKLTGVHVTKGAKPPRKYCYDCKRVAHDSEFDSYHKNNGHVMSGPSL